MNDLMISRLSKGFSVKLAISLLGKGFISTREGVQDLPMVQMVLGSIPGSAIAVAKTVMYKLMFSLLSLFTILSFG